MGILWLRSRHCVSYHRGDVTSSQWARQDSNLRPKDYESSALTAELRARGPAAVGECRWQQQTVCLARGIGRGWRGRAPALRAAQPPPKSSGGETRTLNLTVNSRLLCRLSYPGRGDAPGRWGPGASCGSDDSRRWDLHTSFLPGDLLVGPEMRSWHDDAIPEHSRLRCRPTRESMERIHSRRRHRGVTGGKRGGPGNEDANRAYRRGGRRVLPGGQGGSGEVRADGQGGTPGHPRGSDTRWRGEAPCSSRPRFRTGQGHPREPGG